ncbi:hypothetical protein BGZ52_010978, partial [Haplosporangium bisporale]
WSRAAHDSGEACRITANDATQWPWTSRSNFHGHVVETPVFADPAVTEQCPCYHDAVLARLCWTRSHVSRLNSSLLCRADQVCNVFGHPHLQDPVDPQDGVHSAQGNLGQTTGDPQDADPVGTVRTAEQPLVLGPVESGGVHFPSHLPAQDSFDRHVL